MEQVLVESVAICLFLRRQYQVLEFFFIKNSSLSTFEHALLKDETAHDVNDDLGIILQG